MPKTGPTKYEIRKKFGSVRRQGYSDTTKLISLLGGIGIHTGFRYLCLRACGFDSRGGHENIGRNSKCNRFGSANIVYMATKYTKEVLQEAANNSVSIAGVLRYLNLRQAGGTQTHISKRLKALEVDTSHFTGKAHNKGKVSNKKKPPALWFIILDPGSRRTDTIYLRRALTEDGVEEKCNHCGLGKLWNNNPITLEINHIDGNWLNNLKENLEFVCPNCHSQESHTNKPHKYRN